MKENTVFHFGTSERKYSCFEKQVANGRRKLRHEAADKPATKRRLFLRQTNAGESFSIVRRVPAAVLIRYREGFEDLAAAMVWADALMAEEVKKFRVNFTSKPHPMEAEPCE